MEGKVKWFNQHKAFGFIDNGEGPDIYFNIQSLSKGAANLCEGADVSFDVFPVDGKKLMARNVRTIRKARMPEREMPRFVMT